MLHRAIFILLFLLCSPNVGHTQQVTTDKNQARYEQCLLDNMGNAQTNYALSLVKEICRNRHPRQLTEESRPSVVPWHPVSVYSDQHTGTKKGAENWTARQTVLHWEVDGSDLVAVTDNMIFGGVAYAWGPATGFCHGTLPHYSVTEYLAPFSRFPHATEIEASPGSVEARFNQKTGPYRTVFPYSANYLRNGYCFALFALVHTKPPESDEALELGQQEATEARRKQWEVRTRAK